MRIFIIPGVLLICLLSGCASLSKDECLTADWRLIGYEDGLKGSAPNRIGEHRESCAKHGVTPDKNAYSEGYNEGILSYCSHALGLRSGKRGVEVLSVCPAGSDYHAGYAQGLTHYCSYDVGYREGLNGRTYRDVCPGDLEEGFLSGYELGSHIHRLERTADSLSRELEEVAELQVENERNIDDTKYLISDDETLDREQRRYLLEQLEDYNELSVELQNRHVAIEVEMARIQQELAELGAGL